MGDYGLKMMLMMMMITIDLFLNLPRLVVMLSTNISFIHVIFSQDGQGGVNGDRAVDPVGVGGRPGGDTAPGHPARVTGSRRGCATRLIVKVRCNVYVILPM